MLRGVEFLAPPVLSLAYFTLSTTWTWPTIFFNNFIITLLTAVASYLRSRQLAKFVGQKGTRADRLLPFGPAFVSLILAYLAVLQLIFTVTHLSYYRNGPLIPELFDR
jgi:predicted small integral membrane protein